MLGICANLANYLQTTDIVCNHHALYERINYHCWLTCNNKPDLMRLLLILTSLAYIVAIDLLSEINHSNLNLIIIHLIDRLDL